MIVWWNEAVCGITLAWNKNINEFTGFVLHQIKRPTLTANDTAVGPPCNLGEADNALNRIATEKGLLENVYRQ